MSRRIALALLAVGAAVIVQTTLLARIPVFGVVPDLVLLTVIACARRLDAEPAVVLGFTAGLVIDLLGSAPLGLRAMVLTIVAYATVRTRERFEISVPTIGVAVWGIAFGGGVLLVIVGTLFGERILSDPLVLRQILLGPVYDVILAAAVLPLMTRVLGGDRRREMVL
ncbi:rod shape-determining protein MreD [bacterium BMS3Bbin01]|nr:rod shape-determining protein MreD [bacterium BMS3Bbin01]